MDLVWKLPIFTYNYANLNSYYGRSRQVRILGNFPDFPTQFEPQINSVQIQKQFPSSNFNSSHVWNLNLLPKGKLFLIFHSIILQSLVNFGVPERWYSKSTKSAQFGKIRNQV
jgi:hypothetical protein